MSNKVLDRLLQLTKEGYEIRIKPDIFTGVEIRLTKDHRTVAHVITPDKITQSKFCKSDEDCFTYVLTDLEYRYLDHISKLKEYGIV